MSLPMNSPVFDAPALRMLAYACGIAGQFAGSRDGPSVFREALSTLPALARDISWDSWIEDSRPFSQIGPQEALRAVTGLAAGLAADARAAALRGGFPVLIGGDHSAAAGYWSGIAQAHQPRGDIGLVWIDAHMDSHTPFTSPNGYVHGMPLAALLGHGDPGLTGLLSPRAKLRPDRVCLIGTRDFEPEEAALLRTLDVRVFYMDEVRSRGLERVLDDALEIVGRAPAGFGVTLDLDGIEPGDAPGVSTPSPNGLRSDALLPGLRRLLRDRRCVGLEISEFNPSEDKDGRTLDFMLAVVANLVRDRAAGAS